MFVRSTSSFFGGPPERAPRLSVLDLDFRNPHLEFAARFAAKDEFPLRLTHLSPGVSAVYFRAKNGDESHSSQLKGKTRPMQASNWIFNHAKPQSGGNACTGKGTRTP